MTLATPFKKTQLSAVLVASLFMAASCTTMNSETQSLDKKQPVVGQSVAAKANAQTKGVDQLDATNWNMQLGSCSDDYKTLIEPEVNKFTNSSLTYDQLFASNSKNVDVANQLDPEQSAECKQSALTVAEQMNLAKIKAAEQQLQKQDISEQDRIEALSNLRYAEQALFFSYVRHGFIADEEQNIDLWFNAKDIWTRWSNQPAVIDDANSMINILITNKAMISSVSQLTDYLQNYTAEVNKNPKKKELLLNQTLIFLAQSEANNRQIRQTLDTASNSLPWLKSMTAQLTDNAKVEQDSTKQDSKITVNDTESTLNEFLQRDESQYFTQLLKLTAVRYQQFDEDKLLESGKTFLTEEVEDLALSELLTAMDYAKIGDMESSKRWLDKSFANNDVVNDLCQLPNSNPGSLNPFFKEKNGQQLLAVINQQCS